MGTAVNGGCFAGLFGFYASAAKATWFWGQLSIKSKIMERVFDPTS